MTQGTAIQWTDATWNVVTGCTRVSPGCARCYIERTPPFRIQKRRFERVGTEETTGVTLHWDRLDKPPRGPKIFTPSLGDLFHEEVPDEFVRATIAAMNRAEGRIFQILTKRPERALEVLYRVLDGGAEVGRMLGRNIWIGVSIENCRFSWRADVLREIPAVVRFVSAEPLLGSLFPPDTRCPKCRHMHSAHDGIAGCEVETNDVGPLDCGCQVRGPKALDLTGIDWLIVGGESGPGARPMRIEWAREVLHAADRDNYRRSAADIPDPVEVFVKQLGCRPYTAPDGGTVRELDLHDAKGGDWDEWPDDLRIRDFPRNGFPVETAVP